MIFTTGCRLFLCTILAFFLGLGSVFSQAYPQKDKTENVHQGDTLIVDSCLEHKRTEHVRVNPELRPHKSPSAKPRYFKAKKFVKRQRDLPLKKEVPLVDDKLLNQ